MPASFKQGIGQTLGLGGNQGVDIRQHALEIQVVEVLLDIRRGLETQRLDQVCLDTVANACVSIPHILVAIPELLVKRDMLADQFMQQRAVFDDAATCVKIRGQFKNSLLLAKKYQQAASPGNAFAVRRQENRVIEGSSGFSLEDHSLPGCVASQRGLDQLFARTGRATLAGE